MALEGEERLEDREFKESVWITKNFDKFYVGIFRKIEKIDVLALILADFLEKEDAWFFATSDAKLDGGVIASILRHKTRVNVHEFGGNLEWETKKFAFLGWKDDFVKIVSVRTKIESNYAPTKAALVSAKSALNSTKSALVSNEVRFS